METRHKPVFSIFALATTDNITAVFTVDTAGQQVSLLVQGQAGEVDVLPLRYDAGER